MKILLDENLPKKLKQDLSEHIVFTVRECGWNGKKNGELLALMQQELFDVLITFDKNLRHQQNFTKYTVSVMVLSAKNNSYPILQSLVELIKATLQADLPKGATIISDKTDIYGNTLLKFR